MNDNSPVLPRRTAVAGTVAVCGLASACARYGGPTAPPPADTIGDAGGGSEVTGEVLGLAKDVPVGGGVVFSDRQLVVTQPSAGQFKGFSALCTHQGCVVTAVRNGTIDCDCHGSKFAVADGSVTAGPAPQPLAEQQVSVDVDGRLVTGGTPPPDTTEPPAEQTTEPAPPGLASTADIPVGGGTVFGEQEVVITQPTPGEFRCFSAVCTHQGCLVSTVAGGTINCDCHGSKFAVADGSVTAGPASEPLGEREVLVTGDQISLA
ncbi:MAG TPA: Rieske (2Fe-2S) protein [Actinophytocola sp.]|nr:Rieske (2Fe-2S) protein [Actinophytocola sp.]